MQADDEALQVCAETFADMMGVYGGCNAPDADLGATCESCSCRIGFVIDMKERLRDALNNSVAQLMVRKLTN